MKKLTIKDFEVIQTPDYITTDGMIDAIGKRRFNAFIKWMQGQTGVIIEGQVVYYPCDVERFLKGKDPMSY